MDEELPIEDYGNPSPAVIITDEYGYPQDPPRLANGAFTTQWGQLNPGESFSKGGITVCVGNRIDDTHIEVTVTWGQVPPPCKGANFREFLPLIFKGWPLQTPTPTPLPPPND